MRIRSITSFWDPRLEAGPLKIPEDFGQFRSWAANRFQEAGFEVQTTRLATVEFPTYLDCHKGVKVVIKQVKDLEAQAKTAGFEYVSFGPVTPPAGEVVYDMVPELLANSSIAFFSGVMAAYGVMYPHYVRKCAQIIRANREIEPEGFANLRFAALAQVRPGSPFFPAAYGRGNGPAFALAIECADEAVQAFESARSLGEARRLLINGLNDKARQMEQIAFDLSKETGFDFGGFDFSLAPFPDDSISLGAAMEQLGISQLGQSGSLAAAAFVADTLDLGQWKRAGFNGLFLPVLEDSRLAKRSAEGILTVQDLLMFSAVCGTGLDTVPLPGDASEEDLTALLMDVATLATRLGKPLTARLMPIPGKVAGDETNFSFGFFANGRVMALKSGNVGGLLGEADVVDLKPRHIRLEFKE
jgi:uncharacterized protein (UPF0210 family)